MNKIILVPTDFSPSAGGAMQYAEILAKETGSMIEVIYVKQDDILPPRGGEPIGLAEAEPRIHELLEQTAPEHPSIKCHYTVRRGYPPDEILDVAYQKKVEMIVMATHGRTSSPTVPIGVIATAVLEKADCPVIVVKRPSRSRVSE